MRLYIVRHGKAERESDTGLDKDRALRPRGVRQAKWLSAKIAELEGAGGSPAGRGGGSSSGGGGDGGGAGKELVLLTSRYTRAIDTAKVIQKTLRCELKAAKALELGHPTSEAITLIREQLHAGAGKRAGASKAVVIVGHNPQLETVIGELLGDRRKAPALRTGEAVVFEVKPTGGDGWTVKLVDRLRAADGWDD